MKKLRDHFDKKYREKYGEKVCSTYHSTWNYYFYFFVLPFSQFEISENNDTY